MKAIIITALAALTLSACNSGGPTYITAGEPPMAKIQVSATGKTNMAPDMATVSAGVVTQGKTKPPAKLCLAMPRK